MGFNSGFKGLTDKQNCSGLIYRSFIQYYYMFWAVYISHHQVGIGAQKE